MTIEYHVFVSCRLHTSWLEDMGIYLYIEIWNIGESEVLWKPWWFCMNRSIIATKNGSWSKGFLELHVLSSALLISHVDFYPHWTYIQYTSTFLVKRQCSRIEHVLLPGIQIHCVVGSWRNLSWFVLQTILDPRRKKKHTLSTVTISNFSVFKRCHDLRCPVLMIWIAPSHVRDFSDVERRCAARDICWCW